MGLGRLARGDKRPIRGVPFHIEQLRKEIVTSNTIVKQDISVVQYKEAGELTIEETKNSD
jgi:hypothetical protein